MSGTQENRGQHDYTFVNPFVEPSLLALDLTKGEMGGIRKIYDKERVVCDCLRYRNEMYNGKKEVQL